MPAYPGRLVESSGRAMMRLTTNALAAALGCAFAVCCGAEDASHNATYFGEAKITVNDRAHEDGYLSVRVQPENGAPREATVDLHKHMSENDIAKGIATALEPVLAPDYKVERDAGEHVKIHKAKKTAANFSVAITFNSPGFSIILDN
jgi:hypothetical protein